VTLGGRVRKKLGAVATTYPNGLSSTFVYDDLNRLKSVNGYQYQLGPTGNRQSATEPNGRTLSWTYDGIYRLTNETISLDPRSKNGTVDYGLDPVGNRLSQTSTLPGISSGNFNYDANDRLSTETYDANGNTLTSGGKTFAYDFENRVKSMNGSAVTLIYDGDDNRVAKTISGVATRYLVDDLNPTGYAQVVEELVGGAVQRTYTYGSQRINQNQLISSTWAPSFYGYDGGGHVRALTDAVGTVTDTYDFDAWGNTVNSTGSTTNVYLYRGEQYDPDLGLYYLRARYFNPVSGRFLSRDSADGVPTDPTTLHKYLYASASPINGFDPSGHNTLIEYTLLLKFIGPLTWPKMVLPNLCMWFPAGPSTSSDDTASCGCDGCKARTPSPNSKDGPDVCAYYGDLCKSCGDKYACNAEKCCRGFGDNKRANCVRLCLVAKDRDCVKDHCKNPTRLKVCRLEIHAACYAKCFYVPGVTAPWSYDKSCWDTFLAK